MKKSLFCLFLAGFAMACPAYARTPTALKIVQSHLKELRANNVNGAASFLSENIAVVTKANEPDGKPVTSQLYRYTMSAQGMTFGNLKSFRCVETTADQIECDLKFVRIAKAMKRSFALKDGLIVKIWHGKAGDAG